MPNLLPPDQCAILFRILSGGPPEEIREFWKSIFDRIKDQDLLLPDDVQRAIVTTMLEAAKITRRVNKEIDEMTSEAQSMMYAQISISLSTIMLSFLETLAKVATIQCGMPKPLVIDVITQSLCNFAREIMAIQLATKPTDGQVH